MKDRMPPLQHGHQHKEWVNEKTHHVIPHLGTLTREAQVVDTQWNTMLEAAGD